MVIKNISRVIDLTESTIPGAKDLNVSFFNGTLKHDLDQSNTHHVYVLVEKELKKLGVKNFNYIHLIKYPLLPAVSKEVGDSIDRGPYMYEVIDDSDIVIFGTPIWWNAPSSLIQCLMERMNDFDEEYIKKGVNRLYGKTFGAVITGSEDGVMTCHARMMMFASYLGMTIPPETLTYWVGESGIGGGWEQAVQNKTTKYAAKQMAKNLVNWTLTIRKQQGDKGLHVLGKKPYKT